MTRDQIAGFMFGMSIGVVIGYLLKPPHAAVARTPAGRHQAMQNVYPTRDIPEEKTA